MNKLALIAGLAVAASASAEVLLVVDLSVMDQVTITATNGASSATVSGSDGIGVYLVDIYTAPTTSSVTDTLVSGDLTANGDSSDGSPNLFGITGSLGLNIFSWTNDDPSDFVTGTTAFLGSATWNLASDDYAELLAGNTFGDIYAFADTDDDIPDATIIGQYSVIPAPSALALLGLGGLATARRRR